MPICPSCNLDFAIKNSMVTVCCSRKCANEKRSKDIYSKNKRDCECCGNEFLPIRRDAIGRFCSNKCQGKHSRSVRVERHGYWYLVMPSHPRCNKQGYVAEHRVIMEKEIKRLLGKDEVVHHINEDRKDNRICNLQLMSVSEHNIHHLKLRKRIGK